MNHHQICDITQGNPYQARPRLVKQLYAKVTVEELIDLSDA